MATHGGSKLTLAKKGQRTEEERLGCRSGAMYVPGVAHSFFGYLHRRMHDITPLQELKDALALNGHEEFELTRLRKGTPPGNSQTRCNRPATKSVIVEFPCVVKAVGER